MSSIFNSIRSGNDIVVFIQIRPNAVSFGVYSPREPFTVTSTSQLEEILKDPEINSESELEPGFPIVATFLQAKSRIEAEWAEAMDRGNVTRAQYSLQLSENRRQLSFAAILGDDNSLFPIPFSEARPEKDWACHDDLMRSAGITLAMMRILEVQSGIQPNTLFPRNDEIGVAILLSQIQADCECGDSAGGP